jgi:hypothetical protein
MEKRGLCCSASSRSGGGPTLWRITE